MTETSKLTLKCRVEPDAGITLEGPDEDGDVYLEMVAQEDAITLDEKGLQRLHDWTGRVLAGLAGA